MKPNIVMMISHDSGRMYSNYGYQIATPNFEELAKNSIQFDNYFCPAPQCSPSRGSILTGKYPHNNGLMGLAHLGFSINEGNITLPMALRSGGYETTLIGLSHETINEPPAIEDRIFSSTTELGYNQYVPVEGDRAPRIADAVIDYLQNYQKDQPFYLNVGFFETHRDFDEYQPYADDIEDVKVFDFMIDNENTEKDVALFNGAMKVLDESVGRIVKYIDSTKFKENTIIIYTTDHGVAFPGAKGTLKDSGLGTALLISVPGGKKGLKKKALLCNVDLLPTILDLVGLEVPRDIDGCSFAEAITTEKDSGREEFFCEMTWHDKYQPMRGIRTNEYSYVKNFEDGPKIYVTVDAHLSLSGSEMREKCYVPNDPEELYDLSIDPLEENNVIDNPEYAQIAQKLRKKVNDWMIETNDPLLNGPIKGQGSKRWATEIAEGRAYPGREVYFQQKNNRDKEL